MAIHLLKKERSIPSMCLRLPLALMLATAAALPVEHSQLLALVQDDLVGLERRSSTVST
jgi:hypothetical protein